MYKVFSQTEEIIVKWLIQGFSTFYMAGFFALSLKVIVMVKSQAFFLTQLRLGGKLKRISCSI
jgi:hypothetical protein